MCLSMDGAETLQENPAPLGTRGTLQPQLRQDSQQAARVAGGTATFFCSRSI